MAWESAPDRDRSSGATVIALPLAHVSPHGSRDGPSKNGGLRRQTNPSRDITKKGRSRPVSVSLSDSEREALLAPPGASPDWPALHTWLLAWRSPPAPRSRRSSSMCNGTTWTRASVKPPSNPRPAKAAAPPHGCPRHLFAGPERRHPIFLPACRKATGGAASPQARQASAQVVSFDILLKEGVSCDRRL